MRFLYLSTLCLVLSLLVIAPSHAQSFAYDPSRWLHDGTGSTNPCYQDSHGQVGLPGSIDQIGPAGEPTPCAYRLVSQGYNKTLAPLLLVVLPVLVVILAIWAGHSGLMAQFKRYLAGYSH